MSRDALRRADELAAAVYPTYRRAMTVDTSCDGGKALVAYLEDRTGMEIFTCEDAEAALRELGVL